MTWPARRSSSQEFEEFARRYSPLLLRTAFWLTGDRDAAEDLVQTTLLRALAHWAKARTAPEAYCHRILVNAHRDELRRRQRRRERWYLEALPVSVRTGDATDRLAIARALASLSEAQREVVVLRFYLDLTVPAVAKTLGIPEGTVKSTTSRALARLSAFLTIDDREEISKHVD